MATEVAIIFFTINFLVFNGNDHSVKVSSNSEMGSGQLFWSSQRIGVKYCLIRGYNVTGFSGRFFFVFVE